MNYSISFKDAKGLTDHSEFGPHDSDEAAISYAKEHLAQHAIVEVWKNNSLVARFEPSQSRSVALDSWTNEGGATT